MNRFVSKWFPCSRIARGSENSRGRVRSPWVFLFGTLLLSGCATYHPKPLPTGPDLMRSPVLAVPAKKLDLPGLKPHPFDPAKGLDETTVMTLAVLNNPDLKTARLQSGLAQAQVLEAGLLPDPVVSGGLSQSSVRTGYNVGLSEDLQALITRGAARAAARAHARQVNLDILWQEWQVAERARELFIQSRAGSQLEPILKQSRDLLADCYKHDASALQQDNVTANTIGADLVALSAADAQLRQVQLQNNQTRHALNELLGLKPDVKLQLARERRHPAGGLTDVQNARRMPALPGRILSRTEFQAAIAALPHRRADLLALQAGYESQQQRLREAILAQFPSINAGVQQAKSAEEGVHTIGFTVNVTLPIFNRNRGEIAIQRATRAILFQTYQARLDQSLSEANQLWSAAKIMAGQLRELEMRLPDLKRTAAAAQQAYQQGNLDIATYVNLESNFLTTEADTIHLRAALEQAQAALATLLGLPFDAQP